MLRNSKRNYLWRIVNVEVTVILPQRVVPIFERFEFALLHICNIVQPLRPQVCNVRVLPVIVRTRHRVHQNCNNHHLDAEEVGRRVGVKPIELDWDAIRL